MPLNRTQSREARHANKNKIAKTSNNFLFENLKEKFRADRENTRLRGEHKHVSGLVRFPNPLAFGSQAGTLSTLDVLFGDSGDFGDFGNSGGSGESGDSAGQWSL